MNTKQELIDAINRENKGQAPPAIFTQTATVSQMDACGSCWPEAHFDAKKMADLALQPSAMFGFATARLPYDLTIVEERLGCTIDKGTKDRQPSIIGSPWRDSGDMSEIPDFMPFDEFTSGGRISVILEAAADIGKNRPDLFLTTGLTGPVGVVSSMVGMENFLMSTLMDLDCAEKWLDKITPYLCEYARLLSEASDNVMVIEDAEEDILAPEQVDQFVTPRVPKIMKSIGSSYSTLHTCGSTGSILEVIAGLGEDILSVETRYDPQGVLERVGGKVVLAGGVNPVDELFMGKPETIVGSAKAYSDMGYDVIAPECGVPPTTPDANLAALSHYRD